jgi:hypothetical protein
LSYAGAGALKGAERLQFDGATAGRRVSPGLAAMARLAIRDYANARKLLEYAIDTRASGMDPMPSLLIQRPPEWQSLRARLGGARWLPHPSHSSPRHLSGRSEQTNFKTVVTPSQAATDILQCGSRPLPARAQFRQHPP